uniref:Uncharacterized protein n=1 Tax=Arundo donax TaxID=35708 RepID=A0A0A8ZPZ7_ARUDO
MLPGKKNQGTSGKAFMTRIFKKKPKMYMSYVTG